MKEIELRKYATCGHCHKLLGETKMGLLFYRVKVERHILDLGALQRQSGLAVVLGGNGRLAHVMGPDEDMTNVIETVEFTICENCSTEAICVAQQVEQATKGDSNGLT